MGSKYDLMVSRNQEFYLVEVKYKSKEIFKNWVDKTPYDEYRRMSEFGVPFLYFIYVEGTDKIYKHSVVNPENFRKGIDSKGKAIYYLPEISIREIEKSFLERIDAWFDWKLLGQMFEEKGEEF